MIEPTHIERRRRSESLAELLRQVREKEGMADADEEYESIAAPPAAIRLLPAPEEDETEELPPVPAGEDYTADAPRADGADGPAAASGRANGTRSGGAHGIGRGAGLRRAAITVAVVAAALIGFALALLLPGAGRDDASPAGAGVKPSATPAGRDASGATDPDGAGTLREGDSGPEVAALQQRLLHIPDVYDHGSTSGTYDAALTAAVARFQLWYGIRGDESGVYGNDTRADLESRTAAP
ncbi:peptidoglycan-binding protein [Streptomyces sp. NPDC091209]|uniref:peptidoglycan-binding protein n=1 Tax=Streptomyces sp. NPDC091209 TaxID=3365974 RepID=UPI00382A3E03